MFWISYLRLFLVYYKKKKKKDHGEWTDNLPIRIFVNRIENRNLHLELRKGTISSFLTPERMKLLGSPKGKTP